MGGGQLAEHWAPQLINHNTQGRWHVVGGGSGQLELSVKPKALWKL